MQESSNPINHFISDPVPVYPFSSVTLSFPSLPVIPCHTRAAFLAIMAGMREFIYTPEP
jgi:hypothetical protein